jgi:gamma-glutamylcyclotransferase (GGCT)/AIG2-like uncharacterized protein YtfP
MTYSKIRGHSAVFVYGSLKTGHRLNRWLNESTYEGAAMLYGYRMYDLGAFPGIVPMPEGARRDSECVRGEVWLVPDWLLPSLDRVEGVPNLYTRERVTVHRADPWPPSSDTCGVWEEEAETYVLAVPLESNDKRIESGWWLPRGGGDGDGDG